MSQLRLSDLLSRQAACLIASSAFIGIGGAFVVTTLSLFLFQEVGVSAFWVGVFFAVRAISEVFSDLVIGYISDGRFKRNLIAIACTLLSGCGALLLVFSRDYIVLMAGTIVFFGLGGAIFPQIFALTREVAEQRELSSNAFNAVIRSITSASWVVGPPLAFILIDFNSFATLYIVSALCYFLAAFCLFAGQFDTQSDQKESTRFNWRSMNSHALGIMVFVVLMLSVNMVYQINIALFISEQLGLSTKAIGLIVGLGSALEIPLILLFGILADRFSKSTLLIVAAINAAIFFVLLSFSNQLWSLILIQLPNAIWVSIVLSLPIVMLQDELKSFHGMASSLFSSAFKFGAFFGGGIGGVLVASYGFNQAFMLCASVSIAAGCVVFFSRKKELPHAV